MGYSTVVAGTTITASWANANVRDQVVTPFATTSARDSAITAPVEGMVCYIEGEDRYYSYSGSTWTRTALTSSGSGRTGFILRRAASQSVSNVTATDITWDTEDLDSDGFITVSATTVTIPSGCGGLYVITASVTCASNPGAAGYASITAAGNVFSYSLGGGNTVGAHNGSATGSCIMPCSAAATIKLTVFQDSGGAQNIQARLIGYRIGA